MTTPDTKTELIDLGSHAMILLGAGASVEAGIPATFEMTENIVERVGSMPYHSRLAQTLDFVCAALLMHDAATGEYRGGLDVERVFSAVELLAERQILEVTPFVSSWHPAVDTWDRQPVPGFFDENLQRGILGEHGMNSPQRLIEQLVRAMTGMGSGETYRRLTSEMINALRGIVANRSKTLDYLRPLATAAQQLGGLWVATLNYDLAIEQVGEMAGVAVHTGIEDWIKDGRWNWDSTHGANLLKLHGSIDWCWDEPQAEQGHMSMRAVVQTDKPETESRDPVLLFGQRGKLQAEGPFLSLLAEFEQALSKANRLIVIGYSFRDPHINHIVRRWTTGDLARTIVLVDPQSPDQLRYDDFRSELIRRLRPSSWGPQSQVSDRVDVRQVKASEALALFSYTQ